MQEINKVSIKGTKMYKGDFKKDYLKKVMTITRDGQNFKYWIEEYSNKSVQQYQNAIPYNPELKNDEIDKLANVILKEGSAISRKTNTLTKTVIDSYENFLNNYESQKHHDTYKNNYIKFKNFIEKDDIYQCFRIFAPKASLVLTNNGENLSHEAINLLNEVKNNATFNEVSRKKPNRHNILKNSKLENNFKIYFKNENELNINRSFKIEKNREQFYTKNSYEFNLKDFYVSELFSLFEIKKTRYYKDLKQIIENFGSCQLNIQIFHLDKELMALNYKELMHIDYNTSLYLLVVNGQVHSLLDHELYDLTPSANRIDKIEELFDFIDEKTVINLK